MKFFVEDPTFDPTEMFYIYDEFDYTEVASDLQTLTKNQEEIIKFMKNFDEEMQVRREEKEAEEDQTQDDSKIEMKFFGFSAEDIPGSAKMIYVILFIGIVGAAIGYGLSKLDNSKKSKVPNKRRKSTSPKKKD